MRTIVTSPKDSVWAVGRCTLQQVLQGNQGQVAVEGTPFTSSQGWVSGVPKLLTAAKDTVTNSCGTFFVLKIEMDVAQVQESQSGARLSIGADLSVLVVNIVVVLDFSRFVSQHSGLVV